MPFPVEQLGTEGLMLGREVGSPGQRKWVLRRDGMVGGISGSRSSQERQNQFGLWIPPKPGHRRADSQELELFFSPIPLIFVTPMIGGHTHRTDSGVCVF